MIKDITPYKRELDLADAKLVYDLPRPEALFDIDFFKEKPEAFYAFAEEFLDMSKYEPTPTHHFIKMLQDKGILQINMT